MILLNDRSARKRTKYIDILYPLIHSMCILYPWVLYIRYPWIHSMHILYPWVVYIRLFLHIFCIPDSWVISQNICHMYRILLSCVLYILYPRVYAVYIVYLGMLTFSFFLTIVSLWKRQPKIENETIVFKNNSVFEVCFLI